MTSKKKQETMSEANKCAICWEDIGEKNKSVMNCGHSFHFSCITTNILKGNGVQSMNCPLCRKLIVDKEFEDCCVEIVHDDTESMPELEEEEEEDLWRGSQMWRRDLRLRDRVKIAFNMDTTGEILKRMGWDIDDDDIITTRYDNYTDRRAVIFCQVVRIATEPHEESEGLAPFLIKPIWNLNLFSFGNRLKLQAYRPKQSEVLDIEFSIGWRDEPMSDYSTEEEDEGSWQEMNQEAIIQFTRAESISKRQIHDKPIHEIMQLIDEKIKNTVREDVYKKETVRSLVHKITMDILMEHKNKQREDQIDLALNYASLTRGQI